jgi:hypothetical protein rflaF_02119
MDNSRMSTADMLQYCDEALAWDDFGPIDIYFFESVKKILLGQCSAMEEPEEVIDDLMGIERPVRDVELEPDYDKYADIYYGEEGDDDIPDYSRSEEDEAFSSAMFSEGFFDGQSDSVNGGKNGNTYETSDIPSEKNPEDDNLSQNNEEDKKQDSEGSFTVNI